MNKNNRDKHVFLIRFFDRQYVENFLNNGEIHFNPLQYFIDLENNHGDTTIGDALEGRVEGNISPKNDMVLAIRKSGDKKTPTLIPNIKASFHIDVPSELKKTIGISCFSWLDKDDFVEDEESKYLKLTQPAIKRLRDFNKEQRIPIIIDANKLFDRVGDKKARADDVSYYDPNDIDSIMKLAGEKDNIAKVVFWKRIKYSNQKECRFILKLKDTDEKNNIYVGNLRGVCNVVTNFDDLKFNR